MKPMTVIVSWSRREVVNGMRETFFRDVVSFEERERQYVIVTERHGVTYVPHTSVQSVTVFSAYTAPGSTEAGT